MGRTTESMLGEKNPAWKGGRRLSRGYVIVYVPGHPRSAKNTTVPEHILVAERALGRPISPENPVHHHDENRANNANANLVICESNGYHMLLHARMRILAAGGDPNKEKICGRCQAMTLLAEFHKNRREPDGLHSYCKPCARRLANEGYLKYRKW